MTPECRYLLEHGFSEHYLKTPAGSHGKLRKEMINHPEAWVECVLCHKKYGNITLLPFPVLNVSGRDMREIYPNASKAGACSTKCAGNHNYDYMTHLKSIALAEHPDFYSTKEWRAVRYEVLKERAARCECCGATAKDGIQIHVDHIKPRFFRPELALDKSNLQVLCKDCNFGKGIHDETNWKEAD